LLARGFVGPTGKIVMIDTESGRGELYADVIAGGYDVIPLAEPFTSTRYIAAIRAAEQTGAQIIVIDSASHEWEGIGGVLDQAGDNEARTGKPGLHCWKTPKLEHSKLMAKILQATCPVIVCVRAKHKSRQVKDERGKSAIVKDDHSSPIQAEDFIFEMTAHMEIMPDHCPRITKCSHPALLDCFPKSGGGPIKSAHGAALAAWCKAPSMRAEQPGTASITTTDKKRHDALARELWALTKEHHKCEPLATKDQKAAGKAAVEQWLWDEAIINADGETLNELTDERLAEVVAAIKARGVK